MARKPRISKEETSKPGPKKLGKLQKKPRMVHTKKTQKASKVIARSPDSKSVSSNYEKNSYDRRRKPRVKHTPASNESSIFADFFAKIERDLKQQLVEALRPVIFQCTKEIITEELRPIRMMIENMNDNLNDKMGGLETFVNDRFRDIATVMQNNRPSFTQEMQEEGGDVSEAQLPLMNSNEKFNEANKKLKKRNSVNDVERYKRESENFSNGVPLTMIPMVPTEQKKKRGRKPKTFYQNKTSIIIEDVKGIEDRIDKRQSANKSKEDVSQQESFQKSESNRPDDNPSMMDSVEEKSVQHEDNEMEVEVEDKAQPTPVDSHAYKNEIDAESVKSRVEDESPQFSDKISYGRLLNLVAPPAPSKPPAIETPLATKNIHVVEPERPKPKEAPAVQIQTPVKIYQREPEFKQLGLTSQFQFETSKKTAEKEFAQASSSNEGKYKNDHEFFSFN